ncbi:hypothetical protein KIPB_002245 [Kipferlia bialata]|uniref:Uncharacterized protein n=1 Tax=Kipferlia bialata TaxID=797122 RepID=A0A9K3CPW5_9EUKA|nr:hypothetical protein KIPB_002245 [Kipferlia bialata]|eukprot:g2245.t1
MNSNDSILKLIAGAIPIPPAQASRIVDQKLAGHTLRLATYTATDADPEVVAARQERQRLVEQRDTSVTAVQKRAAGLVHQVSKPAGKGAKKGGKKTVSKTSHKSTPVAPPPSLSWSDALILYDAWKDYFGSVFEQLPEPAQSVMRRWDRLSGSERISVQSRMTDTGLSPLVRLDMHGAAIEIVRSTNPQWVGVRGIVLQETANTLVLVLPREGERPEDEAPLTVLKRKISFKLMLPPPLSGFGMVFHGPYICYTSYDRASRKFKDKAGLHLM